MHRRLTTIVFLALLVAAAAAASVPARGPSSFKVQGAGVQVTGDTQACLVLRGITECFPDRAGLAAREAELALALPAASCSTPLKLFADSGYGGRELDFYDRGFWQNLSAWSFDNQLSSYKVGACGVHLAENANGGGSWYPGNTSANHSEPSMLSGWDNRISSIYIQ
jgi:hypothetical protein